MRSSSYRWPIFTRVNGLDKFAFGTSSWCCWWNEKTIQRILFVQSLRGKRTRWQLCTRTERISLRSTCTDAQNHRSGPQKQYYAWMNWICIRVTFSSNALHGSFKKATYPPASRTHLPCLWMSISPRFSISINCFPISTHTVYNGVVHFLCTCHRFLLGPCSGSEKGISIQNTFQVQL